jgi:hypothetical protein
VTEILSELSPFTRGEVSYHLLILQRCGAVVIEGTRPGPVTEENLYESALEDGAEVAAALEATAEFDQAHRRERQGDHSSGILTMFGIPRPTRTIRLGLRSRTGSER